MAVDHPPRPSLPFSSSGLRLRRRRPQPRRPLHFSPWLQIHPSSSGSGRIRRPLPPTRAGRHPEWRGEADPAATDDLPPSLLRWTDGATPPETLAPPLTHPPMVAQMLLLLLQVDVMKHILIMWSFSNCQL